MEQVKIRRVSTKQLQEMLCNHTPRGRFLAKDGRRWVALDNSTCDAWVEEFRCKHQATRWLRGKFEVGDKAKKWVRFKTAEELIVVARKQGVELDTGEAEMLLGYLEGHDYCLMTDNKGSTVRHDEQYGNNNRGDVPYTVQDTIEFCQEMNDELMQSQDEVDEEYRLQLRADEQTLTSLMERVSHNVAGDRVG